MITLLTTVWLCTNYTKLPVSEMSHGTQSIVLKVCFCLMKNIKCQKCRQPFAAALHTPPPQTLQSFHCELKPLYLESIEKHFSYQNQANGNFALNFIPSPVDINFFYAQSLFHTTISETRTLCLKKLTYLIRWDQNKINQPKILFRNPSFFLICKYPGNGKDIYICQKVA